MKTSRKWAFTASLFISVLCSAQSPTRYAKPFTVIEPDNKKEQNIYIKDNETQQTTLFRKIDDTPMYGFQNFAEYYPNNLYILVRRNEETQNWQDELWQYTLSDKKLIATGRGLSFLVQPKQSYIAYTTGRDILIYDLSSHEIKKQIQLITDPESIEQVEPSKWSIIGNVLWGYSSELDNIGFFFSYDIDKDKLTTFTNVGSSLGQDINPDKGLLLYSDYPEFFDVESENAFLKKNPNVNLYLYNFYTKQRTKVLTQKKKDFTAKWLSSNTFEYYDATLKKRVQKKM